MKKLSLGLAASLLAASATAAPVSWVAQGYFGQGYNAYDELPLSPEIGETFTYSVLFDDETPDADERDYLARYRGAILGATLTIGEETFDVPQGGGNLVEVAYDDNYWHLNFESWSNPIGITYPALRTSLAIWLRDSPSAPQNTDIPDAPPADLSPYYALLYWSDFQNEQQTQDGTYPTIAGIITSIEVRSVPESGTAALLAAGLAGLGFARRRRR